MRVSSSSYGIVLNQMITNFHAFSINILPFLCGSSYVPLDFMLSLALLWRNGILSTLLTTRRPVSNYSKAP